MKRFLMVGSLVFATSNAFAGLIQSANYDAANHRLNVVVENHCQDLALISSDDCMKSLPEQIVITLSAAARPAGAFCAYSAFDVVSIDVKDLVCDAPFNAIVTAADGSTTMILIPSK
jgi:hypothetical protein